MTRRNFKLACDIDSALRHIEVMRQALIADYERNMRKLDNDERDLLGLVREPDGVSEDGK